jgi:isopentenyl phosphate kinase
MAKKVTLIKLGGSIITNKEIPMSLRSDLLANLVKEIAVAKQQLPDELFIVGHGQGSFAHVPATRYKTMDGFCSEESVLGMAIVQDSAASLNRLVVREFLKNELPAVSFYASNVIVTKQRVAKTFCVDVLRQYLEKGLLPVTCGDVLVDTMQGCTIWSTEQILAFFANYLDDHDFVVKRIIHITEVPGFLDQNKKLIENINQSNWPELKKMLTTTKGFDVTGGMGLKVEESLALAKKGIKSFILSGMKTNNLYSALIDKDFVGTEVS